MLPKPPAYNVALTLPSYDETERSNVPSSSSPLTLNSSSPIPFNSRMNDLVNAGLKGLTPRSATPRSAMEGYSYLSCMKDFMLIFNLFLFLGGSLLLVVGAWVLLEPTSFSEMVTADPLLFTGVYVVLALGVLLFLLGLLGCCGAVLENKCLLLFFFMLILYIFLTELAAALLAFFFQEHLTREYFTMELKRHYQGDNDIDAFTSTWNSVMTTFDCCGVSGPEDFEGSLFRRISPSQVVPEACCQGNRFLWRPECVHSLAIRHHRGCYSAMADYFETHICVAGALAIAVLTTQLFGMVFSLCLLRAIQ